MKRAMLLLCLLTPLTAHADERMVRALRPIKPTPAPTTPCDPPWCPWSESTEELRVHQRLDAAWRLMQEWHPPLRWRFDVIKPIRVGSVSTQTTLDPDG